jgi:hypothetical protein
MSKTRPSQDLGFDHLIDELSNALNPASGLPAHLQFPADRLAKVSVPQAVERVSQINAWRAAQKAEADAIRANNAATRLHKEYPDDPRGLRWVQLQKQGDDLPEGWSRLEATDTYIDPSGKHHTKHPSEQTLADALKYEGDTMGHCVGGYCDDVASGRTQIYSLRDAKGQPHVTVEINPSTAYDDVLEAYPDMVPDSKAHKQAIAEYQERYPEESTPRIVQIKGKQNKKPNDEYLPFVQDFVKSGKWSDVGDFHNTGLIRAADQDAMVRAALTGKPIGIDEGYTAAKRIGERHPYFTQDELLEAFKGEFPDKFAQGGPVQAPSWGDVRWDD